MDMLPRNNKHIILQARARIENQQQRINIHMILFPVKCLAVCPYILVYLQFCLLVRFYEIVYIVISGRPQIPFMELKPNSQRKKIRSVIDMIEEITLGWGITPTQVAGFIVQVSYNAYRVNCWSTYRVTNLKSKKNINLSNIKK